MQAINYQSVKGMLTLDVKGFLTLSIPTNSNINGFERNDDRVTTGDNSDSFPFKAATGLLTYKYESKPYSLVVTLNDQPEVRSEKCCRFTLEPNSVVPTNLAPGRFANIVDVSLFIAQAPSQQQAQPTLYSAPTPVAAMVPELVSKLPAANALSSDPMQLLQQLTGKQPPVVAEKSKPGCCNVQVTTTDPRKNLTRTETLSRGAPTNPDHERKVNEVMQRMLQTPVKKQPVQMQPQLFNRSAVQSPPPPVESTISQALQSLQNITNTAGSDPTVNSALSQLNQSIQQIGRGQPPTPVATVPTPVTLPQQLHQPPQQRTIADRLTNKPAAMKPTPMSQRQVPQQQFQPSPLMNGNPLASLATMMAANQNTQAFSGEPPTTEQLMKMADDIIRKAKAGIA